VKEDSFMGSGSNYGDNSTESQIKQVNSDKLRVCGFIIDIAEVQNEGLIRMR
jgi:hypothetical protein